MTKKVAIIGAGLAGLSAGIYLQKSGVTTEIFELAPWAGGVCTAWVRQGYRFDGCIHWMVGTKPGTSIHKLYLEVGALTPDTQIYSCMRSPRKTPGQSTRYAKKSRHSAVLICHWAGRPI
jgi:phytoene dehydrogenase-like protein